MNIDLPDRPFFEEMTSHLSTRFPAQSARRIGIGLAAVLILFIAGLVLAVPLFLLAINLANPTMLEAGKIILQVSGGCLFLVIGTGHWLAGRKFKAVGCWAVTLSLLLTALKIDPAAGFALSLIGVVGMIIALFPRKKNLK